MSRQQFPLKKIIAKFATFVGLTWNLNIIGALLVFWLVLNSCWHIRYNGKESNLFPVLQFKDTLHDFGTIQEGQQVSDTFRFKNTGTGDLLIVSAHSTCGCTVPDYPEKPVIPGESGEIHVVFNSAYKTGFQVKPVFIFANTRPPMTRVTITCNVLKQNN